VNCGYCRDCKWWESLGTNRPAFGECLIAASDGGEPKHQQTKAYAFDGEEYVASLYTRSDFGCVQFEALDSSQA
jgi:hypothetical protein